MISLLGAISVGLGLDKIIVAGFRIIDLLFFGWMD